jgi:hypothetical protein
MQVLPSSGWEYHHFTTPAHAVVAVCETRAAGKVNEALWENKLWQLEELLCLVAWQ